MNSYPRIANQPCNTIIRMLSKTGVLQKHKWENAMTLDRRSWGYRREATASDYLSFHELVTELAETISCGGESCEFFFQSS